MYLLDGNVSEKKLSMVAYTKNQLQVIPKNEQIPINTVIRGKPATYKVQEIVGRKKIDGKVHYQIHWVGFDDPKDYTWQARSILIEDVPDLVNAYEKVNK